jgi:hypothetical protein
VLKNIYQQLNFGQTKTKFSSLQKTIIFLIILSSLIVILETEKELYEKYENFFTYSKFFSDLSLQ